MKVGQISNSNLSKGCDPMKRMMALVLSLVCVLSLVGCGMKNDSRNEVMEEFVGIVINVNENNTNYIVKVNDIGSSELVIGDVVVVQTDAEAGYKYAVNDCIKVEFNGVVKEVAEISMANKSIPRVFNIEKVGTSENNAE